MCFMQGSIDFPRSIDSKSMVELISEPIYKSLYSADEMSYFDMDSDKEIAPALIEYAHFSTIPMLFVDGKLVGSLDLIQEMHRRKKLEEILRPDPNARKETVKKIGMKSFSSSEQE